ncbi:hypothetical protein [Gracilibacillus boraciitolerans]
MYEALVEEQTDVEVVVKTDFSASPVVIEAMNGDDVQLTTLYTGEIFNGHFSIEDTNDRESVLQQAKEGFKETYNFNGTIRSVLKTHMLLQLDRKLRRNII